jgi:hypothetical protein
MYLYMITAQNTMTYQYIFFIYLTSHWVKFDIQQFVSRCCKVQPTAIWPLTQLTEQHNQMYNGKIHIYCTKHKDAIYTTLNTEVCLSCPPTTAKHVLGVCQLVCWNCGCVIAAYRWAAVQRPKRLVTSNYTWAARDLSAAAKCFTNSDLQ